MKKIILCSLVLGFIYIFSATETAAQDGCKNYLGRPKERLCTEKKGYDDCLVLFKKGAVDLCVWTGDPATRIERVGSPERAAYYLKEKGCTVNGIGVFSCDKFAYNVCVGYKNFGAVKGCQLTGTESEIKTKRPDAFELGVQMSRLMYFAAITETEWKKNKTMNGAVYDKALSGRKEALKNAEKAILAINAAIPDKSQQLNSEKLWIYTDALHEDNAFSIASLMKMEYGATLTKNYKILSEAFYFGFDLGAADVIVQNGDAAKRQQAVDSLTGAVNRAKELSVFDVSHAAVISQVKTANPLVSAYFKVFDLRTLYKEEIAKK